MPAAGSDTGSDTVTLDAPPASTRRLVPVLLLSLSAALWGSTFFLAKGVVSRHSPLTVLDLRFLVAGTAMFLVHPKAVLALSRTMWLRAAALGVLYGLAQVPHYYGLQFVPASTAGFLIGTFVVITPVLAFLLFGRRPTLRTTLGALLAVAGLAAFSLHNSGFGIGEVLCLVAAVLYALQIVAMGAWVVPGQTWAITTVEMFTIAVVLAVAAGIDGVDVPTSGADWLVIAWLGLVAGAFGLGVQTWAQTRLPDTQAAVIMAAEPLWAALLAVLFTAETVTTRLVVGGALLLLANVLISTARAPAATPARPLLRRVLGWAARGS